MVQNVTLRVIIAVAVGVAAWFILLQLIGLAGGVTSLEVAVIAVLAVAAVIATFMGLGRGPRPHAQR